MVDLLLYYDFIHTLALSSAPGLVARYEHKHDGKRADQK